MSVAALARDRRVRTLEHESRLIVVIEKPLGPLNRVVAERAVLGEATIVKIILAVTVDALGVCVFDYVRFVTGVALRFAVRTKQRKPRQVVIEKDLVRPRFLVVTIVAGNALATVVRVVALVAGNAVALQFDVEHGLYVTGGALN